MNSIKESFDHYLSLDEADDYINELIDERLDEYDEK